jgi:2-polyprenyl-3-methyl-5-hydroxy-6-metoxy-1,4-benzoquinol methylase
MENVACEICGDDRTRPIAARTDLFLGGDTLFYMVECRQCGAVYQTPRPTPEAMGQFYPSTYQQYTPSVQTESWLRRIDRRYGLRKRCTMVTRHVERGRLLDVGCATGDFLGEMKRQPGWCVMGIEPSEHAARYAQEHLSVPVVNGTLNGAPFADGSFNAITMWDVLEHVYDPRTVIAETARLLCPGGILVVNHPNLRSIDRRIFGRWWLGYELPRHLHLFPASLLSQLMGEHGLEEVEQRCLYGSHAATMTSIKQVAQTVPALRDHLNTLHRVLFSKLVRVACLPYFAAVDRLLLGSNVTAVFRKVR